MRFIFFIVIIILCFVVYFNTKTPPTTINLFNYNTQKMNSVEIYKIQDHSSYIPKIIRNKYYTYKALGFSPAESYLRTITK